MPILEPVWISLGILTSKARATARLGLSPIWLTKIATGIKRKYNLHATTVRSDFQIP